MPLVKDIFCIPNGRLTKGDWGLEIEVEGDNLGFIPGDWRAERDGSLVGNSMEYVLAGAHSTKATHEELDRLIEGFKNNKTVVHDSVRAGVHVHRNVQSWNMKKLFTFIVLYFTLENLLVKWCGDTREGNLFCLRLQDAEDIMFRMYEAISTRKIDFINTDDIRYCSCNLYALGRYGSLEFRSMRTPVDLRIIHRWLTILEELFNSVDQFADPQDVLYKMSYGGEEQYLKSIFPTMYNELMFADFGKTIRQSARRIQLIAYHINWNDFGKTNTNPFTQDGAW